MVLRSRIALLAVEETQDKQIAAALKVANATQWSTPTMTREMRIS